MITFLSHKGRDRVWVANSKLPDDAQANITAGELRGILSVLVETEPERCVCGHDRLEHDGDGTCMAGNHEAVACDGFTLDCSECFYCPEDGD